MQQDSSQAESTTVIATGRLGDLPDRAMVRAGNEPITPQFRQCAI
jgi:hypothetical protein